MHGLRPVERKRGMGRKIAVHFEKQGGNNAEVPPASTRETNVLHTLLHPRDKDVSYINNIKNPFALHFHSQSPPSLATLPLKYSTLAFLLAAVQAITAAPIPAKGPVSSYLALHPARTQEVRCAPSGTTRSSSRPTSGSSQQSPWPSQSQYVAVYDFFVSLG
jgi:hypothetical protein